MTQCIEQSAQLFHAAQQLIPGGVNSPVRAFQSVDATPRYIASAAGAYLTDVDGNRYVDYIGSWGPMILGHAHPAVVSAAQDACQQSLSFGTCCAAEVALAAEINRRMPSLEKMRMVNSGTEATMSAIRLARAATGRDKIIKFAGCYHGHCDSLLVQAGSGALTYGHPSSPGVTTAATQNTLIAEFNHLDTVTALFEQQGTDIAAIIVEPIAGNMNMVKPTAGFLSGLRELCDQYQSLLIFDEVMTGFRVAPGGAQALYNIKPDLTTLGKIIGGGMPVGAFGGRADLMSQLSPEGAVYQAGTLSGNPVAMAAGLATLKQLGNQQYQQLEKTTATLLDGLNQRAKAANIPFFCHHQGSMFGLFFTDKTAIHDYPDVTQCQRNHFKQFFNFMLQAGIYLAPSAYEAGFVSLAHNNTAIQQTLDAAEHAFEQLAS